jgi:hypothetical protein
MSIDTTLGLSMNATGDLVMDDYHLKWRVLPILGSIHLVFVQKVSGF